MKPLVEIFRKDIRRYGWAVAALAFLAVLRVPLFGTDFGLLDTHVVRLLILINGMGFVFLCFFLIVLVVQEESLADPDAYWLTRPMPRMSVFGAKIAFFLVTVVGLSVAAETVTLWMNDGARRIPYAIAGGAGAMLWVVLQMFLAAQTPSMPRYLLLLVILATGFIVFQFAFLYLWFGVAGAGNPFGLLPADLSGHIVARIQTIYWLAAGLGILAFLYWTRRRWLAWGFVLPVAAGALLLFPSQHRFFDIDFGDMNAELAEKELHRGRIESALGVTAAVYRAQIGIPDHEMPDGADLWVSVMNARFTVDGQEVPVESMDGIQRARRISDNGDSKAVYEVELFHLDERDRPPAGAEGRLSATLFLSPSNQTEQARLPLRDGARLIHDGNRLRVTRLSRLRGQLIVEVAAHMPRYLSEPRLPGARWEPMQGVYSFGIFDPVRERMRETAIENLYRMGSEAVQLRVEIPDDLDEEEMELVVFRREGHGQSPVFLNAEPAFLGQ